MKWYSYTEKLPPEYHRVLVKRDIAIEGIESKISTHDIGYVHGDRWKLDSQQWCVLPMSPTINSGIITHWCKLPKFPE